jgi:hypothetical protein
VYRDGRSKLGSFWYSRFEAVLDVNGVSILAARQGRCLFSLRSGCSISNWLIPKGFLISFLQFYYLCVYDDNPQLDAMLSHEARVHVPERV